MAVLLRSLYGQNMAVHNTQGAECVTLILRQTNSRRLTNRVRTGLLTHSIHPHYNLYYIKMIYS